MDFFHLLHNQKSSQQWFSCTSLIVDSRVWPCVWNDSEVGLQVVWGPWLGMVIDVPLSPRPALFPCGYILQGRQLSRSAPWGAPNCECLLNLIYCFFLVFLTMGLRKKLPFGNYNLVRQADIKHVFVKRD